MRDQAAPRASGPYRARVPLAPCPPPPHCQACRSCTASPGFVHPRVAEGLLGCFAHPCVPAVLHCASTRAQRMRCKHVPPRNSGKWSSRLASPHAVGERLDGFEHSAHVERLAAEVAHCYDARRGPRLELQRMRGAWAAGLCMATGGHAPLGRGAVRCSTEAGRQARTAVAAPRPAHSSASNLVASSCVALPKL